MNESRNLQHPDITAAENTGYPWFSRVIKVEAGEKEAIKFCKESFEQFFNFLMASYPYAVSGYLDDNDDDFAEFILSGAAEVV